MYYYLKTYLLRETEKANTVICCSISHMAGTGMEPDPGGWSWELKLHTEPKHSNIGHEHHFNVHMISHAKGIHRIMQNENAE